MIKNLTFALTLATAAFFTATAATAPEIFLPTASGAQAIRGLSNNGKYAVASISPDETESSNTVGAVFYDLTGTTPKATRLSSANSPAGANDVTDDGLIVAGTYDTKPAICRFVDGKWVWEVLPIPDRTEVLVSETTDKVIEVKLNGGEVNAITPDGKYAVGLCRSNEYELVEQAVMWDVANKKIIEVNSPVKGNDEKDYLQTRYTQLSDDGRYLLCWNAFSFSGSLIFVYDREKNETIYIDRVKNADGSFSPRIEGYMGIDLDGASKSLTSDGHYVSGGIDTPGGGMCIFLFDVWKQELKVISDEVNDDINGWSVTKDGLPLGASPAVTPYAYAYAYYDDFLFSFESLYRDVYGLNMAKYGIDNTGKPTQVSDDGRTIVFITGKDESYVARFHEDLKDALQKVNLMSNWSVSPAQNTRMTVISSVTVSFDNLIEVDASKYSSIRLLDSKGNLVANPLANGGVQADGRNLIVSFRTRQLNDGETYTLSIPAGVCHVKGRASNANNAIEVKYVGRADVPVKVTSISPASGTGMASLDLNDNPVVVSFDAPIKINATEDQRPIAHLYIDGSTEPAASIAMDVDLYTNNLVIYPASIIYLYKGGEYTIEVPAGAVCDLSGRGASEAFSITYEGTYTPDLGDEIYLFKATGENFANFLFFEGDYGEPTAEYADFGFTPDTTPWWIVYDDNTNDPTYASHSVYTDGRQSNDWMVTQQIKIPEDVTTYLSFKSQSYRKSKTDRLKVYVYEDNNALRQLTEKNISDIKSKGVLVFDEVLSTGPTESGLSGEWTENVISLEPYQGKNVYICFYNDNQNQSLVMVDDIFVTKDVSAFITVTSPVNVVDVEKAQVKGIISVASELAEYSSLSMTLLDADGKKISSLSDSSVSLKSGDTYNFEFPDALPVVLGEENPYTIEYKLDDDELSYEGVIRNLAFQPVKRVVVEEYTGQTCQYCPLGILAMENLQSRYGDQIIPVVLHAYGGDPKGLNITNYANAVFLGDGSAPSGRINRRPTLTAPMYSDRNNKYHFTAADVPGADDVWQDVVVDEFNEPTFLDLDVEAIPNEKPNVISYKVTVSSALNLKNQNIRVLGMLLEDGIIDYQVNALYAFEDEALGAFGKGGQNGYARFYYTFNNVARGYWGQSSNGTGRLIPTTLSMGEDYDVSINYPLPAGIQNPENLKMAVILLDENSGRVINACVEKADVSGVEEIIDETGAPLSISKSGSEIAVAGEGAIEVAVYSLDGRMISSAHGSDRLTLTVNGYKGVVIVRAASAGQSVSQKIVM